MHAPFAFSGNVYGSTFFMATGFHGFHVLIGTIFLLICWMRASGRAVHAAAVISGSSLPPGTGISSTWSGCSSSSPSMFGGSWGRGRRSGRRAKKSVSRSRNPKGRPCAALSLSRNEPCRQAISHRSRRFPPPCPGIVRIADRASSTKASLRSRPAATSAGSTTPLPTQGTGRRSSYPSRPGCWWVGVALIVDILYAPVDLDPHPDLASPDPDPVPRPAETL